MEKTIVLTIPDWLINFPWWGFVVILWGILSYLVIGPFFSRRIYRSDKDYMAALIVWIFSPITSIGGIIVYVFCYTLHAPIYKLVTGEKLE